MQGESIPRRTKSICFDASFLFVYDFVRQTFDMALPHPRHIRTWYSKINGDPSFTRCAFAALAAQVKVDTAKNRRTICALMLDEMAIRKHIQFADGEYHGFVDVGNGQQDDSAPMAKYALVLMAVSVNASWKIPVGYFLVDGMSGPERGNVIRECLHRLHATGVQVVSLTCDGPPYHSRTLEPTFLSTHQLSKRHSHIRLTRPFVLTFYLMHATCLSLSEILWPTVAYCSMLKVDVFLGDLLKASIRCKKVFVWGIA